MAKLALVMAVLMTLALWVVFGERSKAQRDARRRDFSKSEAIKRARIRRGLRRAEERERRRRTTPETVRLLTGYSFVGGFCSVCGSRPRAISHFATYKVCDPCLRTRIATLRSQGGVVTPDILCWEEQAKEASPNPMRDLSTALEIELDVFVRCNRCGTLLHERDSHAWLAGRDADGRYCSHCVSVLEDRRQPWEHD